ncbi:MAG: hypothetical protein J0I36_14545 [Pandoraea sp.]|uniref:hypothetical protein n=1 Tax=Pandoraea sp. 64-18 TaxID=1895806 RepID=UPI000967F1B3|nr:hypothetical protein [Pandoraea sp. 64-18]MBN9116446.1 hypothetical protein [Pandoraea sp.]OJY20744.1 MAG: hypothetical protein BGP02_09830 [Pandoraea sp. 64-18]
MEIRERLHEAATEFNAAIAAGKVRPLQKVAERVHQVVASAVKEIEAQQPVDEALLDDAMALFMDIRWGQPTKKFV